MQAVDPVTWQVEDPAPSSSERHATTTDSVAEKRAHISHESSREQSLSSLWLRQYLHTPDAPASATLSAGTFWLVLKGG